MAGMLNFEMGLEVWCAVLCEVKVVMCLAVGGWMGERMAGGLDWTGRDILVAWLMMMAWW